MATVITIMGALIAIGGWIWYYGFLGHRLNEKSRTSITEPIPHRHSSISPPSTEIQSFKKKGKNI